MGRELRVSAERLREAADQLDMYATDLHHEHSSANAHIASAVSGFGASLSARALNERVALWEHESANHHAEIAQLGEGHRVAGVRYTTTDSASNELIRASGGGVGELDP